MILYRINSTGLFVPTKPAGKASDFEKVKIPANGNRVAMADYLNGLVAKTPSEDDNPFGIAPASQDDLDHPPAYTRSLVDTMFKPRPLHLRRLCLEISKLTGDDLPHVAFEVAAQIAARANN